MKKVFDRVYEYKYNLLGNIKASSNLIQLNKHHKIKDMG